MEEEKANDGLQERDSGVPDLKNCSGLPKIEKTSHNLLIISEHGSCRSEYGCHKERRIYVFCCLRFILKLIFWMTLWKKSSL